MSTRKLQKIKGKGNQKIKEDEKMKRRETKKAFLWIIKILRKDKVPFQVTGGFAAEIYGSRRKLFDIDIDIPGSRIRKILPDVKDYLIFGPKEYKDKDFDVYMITLKYNGQRIDICDCYKQKIFDRKKKRWITEKIVLSHYEKKRIFDAIVPVITKKELIKYKEELMRKTDIEDIKEIENKRRKN